MGEDYANRVLVPLLRSEIRAITVQHEAKALYTSGRELVASQILESLKKQYADRGVILENVLLRRIKLPDAVQAAIDSKLSAEQEAQKMEFVIMKEKQEAERKKIEAEGIAQYQKITAKEVNEAILRWKGIEATEKLALSPNTKIVVIGGGKDGLPLILQGQ
jgi:regulator of protease activity HflC (stomatin/prohibitin superfamily)